MFVLLVKEVHFVVLILIVLFVLSLGRVHFLVFVSDRGMFMGLPYFCAVSELVTAAIFVAFVKQIRVQFICFGIHQK